MAVLKRTNMSSIFVMCTQISSRLVKKKRNQQKKEKRELVFHKDFDKIIKRGYA